MKYILINFLIKYLFIMRAASDGWRISYIGGNRFEFYNTFYNKNVDIDTQQFLERYTFNMNKVILTDIGENKIL